MFYNEEKANIEHLFLKKNLGLLTPNEKFEFEHLLMNNTEFRQLANYYESQHEQIIAAVDSQLVECKLSDLKNRLKRNRRFLIYPRISPYTAITAAVNLAIIILIVVKLSIQFSSIDENRMTNVVASPYKQVTLQLADGSRIILKQHVKQSIQAGNQILISNNKTLDLYGPQNEINGYNILEVPSKLDYKLNLADGSTIHLNSYSQLKFPFTFPGSTREVYLEGEAYFKIAPKAGQPFTVHTTQGDIKVIGTEFNINTYTPKVLKAALVNGSIQISSGSKKIFLKPGEYFTKIGSYNKIVPLDTNSILSWQNGVYHFHNTPFREIAEMLPRWFDVRLVVDDESLNDIPFTGQLNKAESLDIFLKAMQYTSGIEYYKKDGILHIRK